MTTLWNACQDPIESAICASDIISTIPKHLALTLAIKCHYCNIFAISGIAKACVHHELTILIELADGRMLSARLSKGLEFVKKTKSCDSRKSCGFNCSACGLKFACEPLFGGVRIGKSRWATTTDFWLCAWTTSF